MSQKKRVVILGSTGSIGESALKVARDIPERMEVVGLAAGRSAQALLAQAAEFKPRAVALYDPAELATIRGHLPPGTACHAGPQGLIELATLPEADMVLISIVGTAGLAPALAAIRAGKDIAVASKEILVMAGEEVTREAAKHKVAILPVDSEHNAIFQCLAGEPARHIRRLILTASGGPFRKTPASELPKVTPAQALKHPTWNMGRKITIDSATLFNKGLEMIEARWLFGVPMNQVDVVVHPQSIVHSLVEFVDGSQLAQLSHSDMCFPIQYAVTYPDRLPNRLKPLCLAEMGALTFEAPDPEKFPALRLAREAGTTGGTLPAVLNAANEIAVPAFLDGKILFPAIWHTVEAVMKRHKTVPHPNLDEILAADAWARAAAQEEVAGHAIA
ncbi:MAG TPA: 1-deoxy-D-xylulose-5-phosphate reductoisomerase [Candidatus Methylacidiphilales bacterium]|jgi:1-deoxy-D-xylulose-5-phosphate reductoisomerase|nr:1-deoxy-D-xylulose-5-phosphate reductoisomerase [Candidatus Methylacidiphilales bacterium]